MYELATFCRHVLHVDGRQGLVEKLGNRLVLLSTEWLDAMHPCKNSTISECEIAPLRDFRCANACCHRPSDRALLLGSIRRDWGTLEAFESFVHHELRLVYEHSKRRYTTQLSRVSLETANLMLGDG